MESNSLIDFIINADKNTLAITHAAFSRFEWPEVLPQEYKPDWWNGTGYIHGEHLSGRIYGFCLPFRQYIETKIEKEFLLKCSMNYYNT